ncbi:MAG: hypothetical protein ACUVQX_05830 [Candidatus Bathycorpusculaceae bacterium]
MHIPNIAKELKRFVNAYRYDEWIGYVTKDFEFENFMKGLNWFANSSCTECLQGGGMPKCEVRNCCYFCKNFSTCEKLSYQKETYRIDQNYEKIKRIGYEKWLKEGKLKENFDNIYYLGKRKSTKNI